MQQYSQRDPKWGMDILGFSDNGMSISSYGCLLTASAMVLTNHGFIVDPKTLNKKLKSVNGFTGALMYFNSLATLYPVKVNVIECEKEAAPIPLIQETLDNDGFVIVELDQSPRPGFQNHWVTIYKREGSGKYFISDPWSLHPELETVTLQERYGFSGDPAKIITKVMIIEPINKEVKEPSVDPEPYAPEGDKFVVVIDGLRLRKNPSTNNEPVATLASGTELLSAGKSFDVDGIVWQPVVMYVATAFNGEHYIKAAD